MAWNMGSSLNILRLNAKKKSKNSVRITINQTSHHGFYYGTPNTIPSFLVGRWSVVCNTKCSIHNRIPSWKKRNNAIHWIFFCNGMKKRATGRRTALDRVRGERREPGTDASANKSTEMCGCLGRVPPDESPAGVDRMSDPVTGRTEHGTPWSNDEPAPKWNVIRFYERYGQHYSRWCSFPTLQRK